MRKERQTVDAKALVLGYRIMCYILKGFISFGMYGGLNLHNLFTILIHSHTLLLQSSPGFSMLMKIGRSNTVMEDVFWVYFTLCVLLLSSAFVEVVYWKGFCISEC